MSVRKIILLFCFGLALVTETFAVTINLAEIKGVKYIYLNDKYQPMSYTGNPDGTLCDPESKLLNDGSCRAESTVKTIWTHEDKPEKKVMRVRFEFPTEITASSVGLVWMYSKTYCHWFDYVNIYVGNKEDEYLPVATFRNPCKNENTDVLPIKFDFNQPVKGRFFCFEIIQEAAKGRCMFQIGELHVFGDSSQKATIEAVAEKRLSITFERKYPCNLFNVGDTVVIPIKMEIPFPDKVKSRIRLLDYFGNLVEDNTVIANSDRGMLAIPTGFKQLSPGYYELDVSSELLGESRLKAEGRTTFIVAPLTNRTFEQGLAAGCRFGIGGNFSTIESITATNRLGLHWLRELLCFAPLTGNNPETPDFSYVKKNLINDRISALQITTILSIFTVPLYCYTPEHQAEVKKGQWVMPDYPELFINFVSKQVQLVPSNQKYFEIWNEPPFPAKDFATVAQWVIKGVKAVRPDAIVGPNTGMEQYMVDTAKYGGMAGMDMITTHPYSPDFVRSPEAGELRRNIREGRALVKAATGRDLPVYVTEFGWPTAKGGPMVNTEEKQAAYIVRASIALYAEDVKVITPYCLGQPEEDPNDKEHFFGFVRKDLTPKPVLAAYANMARIIEGSEFVGDLWLGTDIGAMLFKKDGQPILILYADGAQKKIMIRPGVEHVKIIDIIGGERQVDIVENRLSLILDDNPLYLIGVSPELDAQIVRSPTENQWSKIYHPIVRDAKHAETADAAFSRPRSEKINMAQECVAEYSVSWNENNLFLDIKIFDKDPGFNPFAGKDIWQGDAVEIFLSLAPERDIPGFVKEWDYQILISPTSQEKKPVAVFGVTGRELAGRNVQGIKCDYEIGKDYWRVKCILPFSSFGLSQIPAHRKLRFELAVDNLGENHPRYQVDSNRHGGNFSNPAVWSELLLK